MRLHIPLDQARADAPTPAADALVFLLAFGVSLGLLAALAASWGPVPADQAGPVQTRG